MNRRSMVVVCGVLLAVLLPAMVARAADRAGMVAVLPLDARDATLDRPAIRSLEEELRTIAGDRLRPLGYLVLTQETTLALLNDNGIDPTRVCDGTCALQSARELKAALFLTGTIITTGGHHLLFVKLFESASGQQLGAVRLEQPSAEELREKLDSAVDPLFKDLQPQPQPPPAASTAPDPTEQEAVNAPASLPPAQAPEQPSALSAFVDRVLESLEFGALGRFDRFKDWSGGASVGIGYRRVRLYLAITVPVRIGTTSVPAGFQDYGKGLAGGLIGVVVRDLGPVDLVLETGIDAPTIHCQTSQDAACLQAGATGTDLSLTALRSVSRVMIQHRFLINVATSQDDIRAGLYADVGVGVSYTPSLNDTGVQFGTPVGLAVALNVGLISAKRRVWERW